MDHIVILSDDLTGANDSGVQFAKHGIPTVVCVDDQPTIEPSSGEGLTTVLNVESRSLSAEAAYEKWRDLIAHLDISQFKVVFKKIDSTLRGNIGIEIQALMDSGLFGLAVVAPAYPQKGRLTVGGYHLLNQVLLEDSEISRDPKFPITESKVADIIGQQLTMPVGEIEIKDIRSGKLPTLLNKLKQDGVRVVVMDSMSEQDLAIIAAEAGETDTQVLWVGSAGLAEALAGRYPLRGFHSAHSDGNASTATIEKMSTLPRGKAAPVLVVAGSVSQVTLRQVEQLKLNGFQSIEIDPIRLMDESFSSIDTEELAQKAQRILLTGADLVISTDVSEQKKQQVIQAAELAGLSARDGGDRIADRMGLVAAAVIRYQSISGAVLTGGDIAYRTCKHLNITSLKITGEAEEGLPLCTAEGTLNIPIVTKAGAFGGPDSLWRAAEVIKNGRSDG